MGLDCGGLDENLFESEVGEPGFVSLDFLQPLWIFVAVLYVVEQTFSVRKGGWRAVLVSLAVVPELFLNVFLNVVYVMSYYGALFATDEHWGRMRHLDAATFDRHGMPLTASARPSVSALRGTHAVRRRRRSRVVQIILAVMGFGTTVAAFMLPVVDLSAAWSVIAVYVLAGSLATIGRLIPVRTF